MVTPAPPSATSTMSAMAAERRINRIVAETAKGPPRVSAPHRHGQDRQTGGGHARNQPC